MHRLFAYLLVLIGCGPIASQAQTPSWQVRSPTTFQMDADALAAAFDEAANMPPLNSLLIARGDSLVAAQAFRGMTLDRPTNIKSASKTMVGTLFGMAFADGAFDTLHDPIGPRFPEILADTARAAHLTPYHLLTMQAGLESTSFGNYGAWVSSDNWVRNALERPMQHPPGTRMTYSTGTSHILGVLLTRVLDEPLRTYAQRRLFDPLGVEIGAWQQDPQGNYFGGNNVAIPPRGLLRLGQLHLNGGTWNGERVLPAWWPALAWTPFVQDAFRDFQYGLSWWIADFDGVRTYFAWGYGGQFVFVAPELELVAAMTSSLTNRPDDLGDFSDQLTAFWRDRVVPTVVRDEP